ncbi:MAG: helix-turn-helix domain-containing protein [Gemmatimonadota bacterium]|nr:helix-turn-helix domain-containing protein [Gemmatimonadota bacterium]MDH3423951.1 helix-turn-helix domain-containing protein [Gemmatimonadota bacterium]
MIVSRVTDPLLQQALRRAAHPDEDVVTDASLAIDALQLGFPRLLVRAGAALQERVPSGVAILDLDDLLLRRWEAERRQDELPKPRLDDLTRRLRLLLERPVTDGTWVDSALADLSRAAGVPLPAPLRGFTRRVLEFPSRYTSLHGLSGACGLSRGALKARFRRRGLASPYTYLRWFRVMAVAEVLSDRGVSVASAAHRLGFTSAGNLCRVTATLADTTPTELRTVHGWNRLVVRFAWTHLTSDAVDAWSTLTDLFGRRAA